MPFEATFRKNHEPDFQEKLASFGGLDVQANKKKFATKGKGEKTIPQEIVEFLKDMTMVDYEVITLKRDFDDLLEAINKICYNRCFNLSPKSH
jgi:hypothetical protein